MIFSFPGEGFRLPTGMHSNEPDALAMAAAIPGAIVIKGQVWFPREPGTTPVPGRVWIVCMPPWVGPSSKSHAGGGGAEKPPSGVPD